MNELTFASCSNLALSSGMNLIKQAILTNNLFIYVDNFIFTRPFNQLIYIVTTE